MTRLFAAIAVCLGSAALAQTSAIKMLDKLHDRGVVWDTKGALTADVTCDGKSDLVILGKKRGSALVAIVPSIDHPGEPIIAEFPTNRNDLQDGFCGSRLKVTREPRDCKWVDGPIPGCKVVRGCTAFRVDDNMCDGFHFYWDNKQKSLTYNRL